MSLASDAYNTAYALYEATLNGAPLNPAKFQQSVASILLALTAIEDSQTGGTETGAGGLPAAPDNANINFIAPT